MAKTRTVLKILALILLVFLAWFVCQPTLAPLSRNNISLTMISYTNDGDASTRLAVFAVTNMSASTIYVYHPMVIGVVYDSSNLPRWHALLERGSSARFTIRVPTNLPSWTLGVCAYNDVGLAPTIERMVTQKARRLPYDINSDLIDSKRWP